MFLDGKDLLTLLRLKIIACLNSLTINMAIHILFKFNLDRIFSFSETVLYLWKPNRIFPGNFELVLLMSNLIFQESRQCKSFIEWLWENLNAQYLSALDLLNSKNKRYCWELCLLKVTCSVLRVIYLSTTVSCRLVVFYSLSYILEKDGNKQATKIKRIDSKVSLIGVKWFQYINS